MPSVRVDDSFTAHYEDHYFGEPWIKPQVVLMVHGAAESSRAWFAWVPRLARRYRVIRFDQRGSGKSSEAPADFEWSLDALADDLDNFMDALGIEAAHVVAAKLGAAVSLHFAARHRERVRTLSVVGAPVRKAGDRPIRVGTGESRITSDLSAWAGDSQRSRLGSSVSDAQIDWWTDYMGGAQVKGVEGLGIIMRNLDNFDSLSQIQAPTLVITTEGSALGTVDAVHEWSAQIENAQLVVLPGDSYHIAAAEPDKCAELVMGFLNVNETGNP